MKMKFLGTKFTLKILQRWCSTVSRNLVYLTSLVVQWLRLHTSKAGGAVVIPGQGTKIPHAAWRGQKLKEKKIF